MQSMRTGLAFFKLAWGKARSKPGLLGPTFYGFLAGFLLTLLALFPIGLIAALLGTNIISMLLIGLLCAVLLGGQIAFGQLFSLMTTFLFHGRQAQDEKDSKAAWNILKRTWFDTLVFTAAAPGITIQRQASQSRAAGKNPPERAWLSAVYLVLPVMAIENQGLKESLKRTTQIVNENVLRSGANLIGVKVFNRLVGIFLGLVGSAIGLVVGLAIQGAVGACVGIVVASVFILAAINLAAFNRSAYYSCLYLWAQRVEAAQKQPGGEVLAPELITAAL